MENNIKYNIATAILRELLQKKLVTEEEYIRIDNRNKKSF